jgi:uncharacterized protein with von Willebrand factor type A (vWA) domain
MNRERQKLQVDLGKEWVSSGSIEDLKEMIQRYEELGAVGYYIGPEWDRCGDYDATYIEFYGERPETDDEYNARIKREEENEKKRIEEEKKRKEEEIRKQNEKDMKELETYLKLKEKFEGRK